MPKTDNACKEYLNQFFSS
ncbi:TPA: hypothetical protein OY125_002802, partial [Staphylococcus aureus]|nr:hypothetical protein [Staphylococcus aureus]